MKNTKIVVGANIGLAPKKKNESNDQTNKRKQTFLNLHDTLTLLFQNYKIKPSVLALQEMGFLGLAPEPFSQHPWNLESLCTR